MADKEFILVEYAQIWEAVRHYTEAQHGFFRMFLTVYLAVFGGYFYTRTNGSLADMSNALLILGICVSSLFAFLLTTNRAYFIQNLRKLEFLRQRFFYSPAGEWNGYPQFYAKFDGDRMPKEEHRAWRWTSAFAVRIIVVCFACAVFVCLIDCPTWPAWNDKCGSWVGGAVFFLIQLVICWQFTEWKMRQVGGQCDAAHEG